MRPSRRMVEVPLRLRNLTGDTIRGDLRWQEGEGPRPPVIVCHGFTAHKDWGPFPFFGRKFAAAGFASIVFNFSHNGVGGNPRRFTELEKFSRNTIGSELDDLRCVIDAIEAGEIGGGVIDAGRIALVGHSRGAGIALLHASLDRRVKAVGAWSPVATFFRYTDHQRRIWEEQGYLPVGIRSMRTRLRQGIEVLRDLDANRERYDLLRAVQRLSVPLLIVHGRADVTVRPAEAEKIYEASHKSMTDLVLLDRVGHMYGVQGLAPEPNPTIEHIADMTAQWFHLHLP